MASDQWATVVSPRNERDERTGVSQVDKNEVAAMVRRATDGDRAAWETIVEDFSGLLWSVCRCYGLDHADAAEVVQTTWLRLLENLGRLREPEHLGGWLATTARREALRLHRLQGRELATDDDADFDRDRSVVLVDPSDVVVDSDRDRRLWRAFAELPQRCRRLLRMLVVSRPPYAEVAAVLDMPIGSIGPTRARCLDRLRRLLLAQDPSDMAAW
jgi:RNA polymerase sigma factor (sigma-70 family)